MDRRKFDPLLWPPENVQTSKALSHKHLERGSFAQLGLLALESDYALTGGE